MNYGLLNEDKLKDKGLCFKKYNFKTQSHFLLKCLEVQRCQRS